MAAGVMTARRFTREDFAALHPAGWLGQRAGKKVEELMRQGEAVATAKEETPLRDVLFAITAARAGAAAVLDDDDRMAGIITDGDIRRALLSDDKALAKKAREVMTRSPKIARPEGLAIEALRLMKEYKIGDMPVIDGDRRVRGMLNVKDVLDLGME